MVTTYGQKRKGMRDRYALFVNCKIWKKTCMTTQMLEVSAFIGRSRNGFPFLKGCVVNDQITERQAKQRSTPHPPSSSRELSVGLLL